MSAVASKPGRTRAHDGRLECYISKSLANQERTDGIGILLVSAMSRDECATVDLWLFPDLKLVRAYYVFANSVTRLPNRSTPMRRYAPRFYSFNRLEQ